MNTISNEEKRIKIAEACGWMRQEPFLNAIGTITQQWTKKGVENEHCCSGHTFNELPDYFDSLDAMHEAENTLTLEQWEAFCVWLVAGIEQQTRVFEAIHATAAQRAEAFGRTLKLWPTA